MSKHIQTHKYLLVLLFALLMGMGTGIAQTNKSRENIPDLPPHGSVNDEPAGSQTTVTQTIDLVEGWNYVSTYIDMSVVDGLTMLQESLGDHGLTIATFDDQAEYLGGGLWIGLEGYQMTNAEMVFVEVDADCTITLQGPVVDPSTVTITIGPEWTLFGFPVTTEMNIGDALGTFEPEFGDGIGSIDGLAEYLGNWDGDFTKLKPGQGYFYWNESGETKTFVFQTSRGTMTKNQSFRQPRGTTNIPSGR